MLDFYNVWNSNFNSLLNDHLTEKNLRLEMSKDRSDEMNIPFIGKIAWIWWFVFSQRSMICLRFIGFYVTCLCMQHIKHTAAWQVQVLENNVTHVDTHIAVMRNTTRCIFVLSPCMCVLPYEFLCPSYNTNGI